MFCVESFPPAIPGTPMLLFLKAPIIPATAVPCPTPSLLDVIFIGKSL